MKPDTIFINIPVKNLERAVNFYTRLGFAPHPDFRGPEAQCMCLSDRIHVMVQLENHLKQFTPKPVSDPTKSTGVVLCLHCDSKEQIDDLVAKAVAAGGSTFDAPQDLGFLYTHGFLDTDGNVWRLNYIYPEAVTPG